MPPEVIEEEQETDVPAQGTEPTAEEIAAFNEGNGIEEPAPTEDTPPVEPAQPETPPATQDPNETVTLTKAQWDETQRQLQSLAATVEKVSGTAFGKIGGLERTLNELKERTPAGQSIKLTEEDFPKAMREDFPDLVRDQVAAFNKAVERGGPASGITPEEFNRKLIEATTQVEQKTALRFMDGIRSDWRTVVNDAAYKRWLTSQPADYQTKLADSWEPNDVLESIEKFEAAQSAAPKAPPATPPPAQKPAQPAVRSRRMATAVQPKGQGTPTPTAKTEHDYFAEGYKTGRV